MDSSSSPPQSEVAHDFRPFFRVLKDGRIQRFDTPHVPPSTDPITGVQSKDVLISSNPQISARIYLPVTISDNQKLPLLIYFHGGAFSSESAFSTLYHTYLNSLVAATHVIAVSIEYRLAPENPIPAGFEDCWTALKWVSLHNSDPWVNKHANFNRVFLMGDSSGATISHNMAVRASTESLGSGFKIVGLILIHPLFGNNKPDKMWSYMCPGSNGPGDPRINPVTADPKSLDRVKCDNILISTASKDWLRQRGWDYYNAMKKSEWGGVIDMVEIEGEKHVFHLLQPDSSNAKRLMKLVCSFINQNKLSHSSLL